MGGYCARQSLEKKMPANSPYLILTHALITTNVP
jgi:hypothetical protein